MNTTPTAQQDALISALPKKLQKYVQVLRRRQAFLEDRAKKISKDENGNWDIHEAHALDWVITRALSTPPVTQATEDDVQIKEARWIAKLLHDNGGSPIAAVCINLLCDRLLRPSDGWNRDMSKAPRDRSLLLKIGNHYDVGDWLDGGERGWWVAHCVEVHPTAWSAFQFIAPPSPEAGRE